MKYPITPDYIASLPEPLCRLYEGLEAFILSDICSRFKNAETATESAIEQIRVLQRRGYSVEAINKYIKETLKLSDAEFNRMWADAVARNQEYFDYIIDDTDIIGDGFDQLAFDVEINAIERQTMGALRNITRTMGFAIRSLDGKVQMLDFEESYIRVLDDAMLRVETGGCSYSEAIREATKKLTDSGVQYIDYKSGWHNRLDVAVRRAVMTGVTQLSAQYSEQEAEILDTPYREVSAHRGARDGEGRNPWSSHKAWQGKVYSVRDNDIYPSIYAVCGWGEVDGLEGINCRHMHFPFVEGVSERTYTDEELANIDPPPFTFEGRKYTAYEATQKQRQVEATLRKIKREMIAAKSTGDDDRYTQLTIRYNRLNEEYTKFSKAADLKPQRERSYISEFTPKDAGEATKTYKGIAKSADKMYDTGSESGNIDAYMRDLPIRQQIKNDYNQQMFEGRQNKHYVGTNEFNTDAAKNMAKYGHTQSVITVSKDELNMLYSQYSGSGILLRKPDGRWAEKEQITMNDKIIGYTVSDEGMQETSCFRIHYSKAKGWHIVPDYMDVKGKKGQ